MTEKIFVGEDDSTTLICPKCNKSTTADISKFKKLEKLVKLRIVCKCGNPFSVVLERRISFRKEVELPGKYEFRPSVGQVIKGNMTVIDVSRGGIRMKFTHPPEFKVGAKLDVEFNLEDKQNSVIKKEVLIKRISDRLVNAEFSRFDTSDPSDKALGFYLF